MNVQTALEWLGVANTAFKAAEGATKVVDSLIKLLKIGKGGVSPEILDKVDELQQQLATLRIQNTTLKTAFADVYEIVSQRADFIAQAERYALQEVSTNSFAYVAKEPIEGTERNLKLCANCFDKKVRSVLFIETPDFNFDTLKCPNCSSLVRAPNQTKANIVTGPVRRAGRISGYTIDDDD